ncbi:hypothetical protein [Bacillus sp. ISL-46]|uniref:hypothetical protein n=1 Tax=Bacillus sp. ISL-46 TaxID=2819129 RepID=UPI001BE8D8F0|nr:hypothetical protein [Bacillus sp. ISL-46]MBT2723067.1 hypothetical protein [Bacillus sp. ISL-46]
MNQVFGKMVLDVAVDVESQNESMGLLEANYNLNPNRIIAYKLVAVDCKGKEHIIHVNDAVGEFELTEFVEAI